MPPMTQQQNASLQINQTPDLRSRKGNRSRRKRVGGTGRGQMSWREAAKCGWMPTLHLILRLGRLSRG